MAEASATPIIETAPEEWRPIVGMEEDYEVSNHGRIRRLNFHNRHGKKPYAIPRPVRGNMCRRTGYWMVKLCSNGERFSGAVHTIVAAAFLGPKPSPKHQVAHLDGAKDNPVLSNLAYVTQSENEAHKKVHGRANYASGPEVGAAKLTAAQVVEMRSLRARFGDKLPLWVLGRMFDVSKWAAQMVCHGDTYRNVAPVIGPSPSSPRP